MRTGPLPAGLLAELDVFLRQAYERADLFLADFDGVTRWVVDTVLGTYVGWPLGDLIGDVAFDTWTQTYPTSPEVWA